MLSISFRSIASCLAGGLLLVSGAGAARSSVITFEPPPGQDQPIQATGGGSRDGGSCLLGAQGTVPLLALNSSGTIDKTLEAHPTFHIQVPPTAAPVAEFSLFDASGNGLYQTTIALTTPGTVEVSLPESAPALETGQTYQWVFSVICQPTDRLQDQSTSGWIRRTEDSR